MVAWNTDTFIKLESNFVGCFWLVQALMTVIHLASKTGVTVHENGRALVPIIGENR